MIWKKKKEKKKVLLVGESKISPKAGDVPLEIISPHNGVLSSTLQYLRISCSFGSP